jgi:hypothetical protein
MRTRTIEATGGGQLKDPPPPPSWGGIDVEAQIEEKDDQLRTG